MVAVATRNDPVAMERQASVGLGPLGGLMLGVALCTCAAAVSRPRAPATEEGRTLPAPGPASPDARPELRPSYARASAAPGGHGRTQPADALPTLRTSQPRRAGASAAERIYAEVDRRTRTLDASLRARIAREVLAEAARARLDPLLVMALIQVESSFDPDAVSRAGAAGLMQVREATMLRVAARSGLRSTDPLDPVANIQAGVRYLAGLIQAFGDTQLALMAYNVGPGRIRRYQREGGVPERFRAYPQSVARELARLGGSLEQVPAQARLAVNGAPPRRPLHVRRASSPAIALTCPRPLDASEVARIVRDPMILPQPHSREPDHGLHHQSYEQALASKFLAEGLARLEGS
jgi:soluble lytic murein transglycosylase-like protein